VIAANAVPTARTVSVATPTLGTTNTVPFTVN
jgi:hypothetical protein